MTERPNHLQLVSQQVSIMTQTEYDEAKREGLVRALIVVERYQRTNERRLRVSDICSDIKRLINDEVARFTEANRPSTSAIEKMLERRAVPRQRIYKGAWIRFADDRSVIDCVVRNVSMTGAALEVESPVGIPDTFNLVFVSGELSRKCQVVWRREIRIGLKFV